MSRKFQAAINVTILCTAFAHAEESKDPMNEAVNKLCDKTKQCMMETMGGEGMPEEMQKMFFQQIDMQCRQSMKFSGDTNNKKLEKQAKACIEQIDTMSCEQLTQGQQPEACIEYSRLAEGLN